MKKLIGLLLVASMSFAGVEGLISSTQFNSMFPNRSVGSCGTSNASNVYTHAALIEAASWFPDFANSGNATNDKRELAAFLGQTSHETTGGGGEWCGGTSNPSADCFNYGLCFTEEVGCTNGCTNYTASNLGFPPVSGQSYHGRGAMQLSWNHNYGKASEDMTNNKDLFLSEPGLVKTSTWAFRAAIWYWMDATDSRPSPHAIFTGSASGDDRAGSYSGVTNAINGGIECGAGGSLTSQNDRVNFFKKFASDLGVAAKPSSYSGSDADYYYCTNQENFNSKVWTGHNVETNIIQGGSSTAISSQLVSSQTNSSQWQPSSSSEEASSSSQIVNNTDCDYWVEALCEWDGLEYTCKSSRVTSDGITAYECLKYSENWCNGFSPETNLWGQWVESGKCEITSGLSETNDIQAIQARLIDKILMINQGQMNAVIVEVSTILGNRVLSREVDGNGQIDLKYYPAGSYFLRVQSLHQPSQTYSKILTIK